MSSDFVDHVRVRDRHPTVRQAGIAAEHFPSYVNERAMPHDVDLILLTFVRSGRGQHLIGSRTYEIQAPSVAVTQSGQPHSVVTEGGPLEVVNVYLDTEWHPLPALESPHAEALAALVPLASVPHAAASEFAQLPLCAEDRHDALLDLLIEETRHTRSIDLLKALRAALLTTLAHAVLDRGLLRANAATSAAELRMLKVRDWLDRHYLEQFSLADLAARAHVERTYFSHRFSTVVGMPVSEYVARLRIRYAAGLLRAGDLPVAAVAAASGFGDLSHFGRTFRRIIGTSPRAFRAEGRAIQEPPSSIPRALSRSR